MTEKQEIRVKALGLTIEFFKVIKPLKISPKPTEDLGVNEPKEKPLDDNWILEGLFKTCEKFEEFILKAP